MQSPAKNNEHGFALVLELVVVAMVLSALGVGLYQYSVHSKQASDTIRKQPTAVSAAADVNASLIKSANVEAEESTGAAALGDELQATDAASADVEGGIDEGSF